MDERIQTIIETNRRKKKTSKISACVFERKSVDAVDAADAAVIRYISFPMLLFNLNLKFFFLFVVVYTNETKNDPILSRNSYFSFILCYLECSRISTYISILFSYFSHCAIECNAIGL